MARLLRCASFRRALFASERYGQGISTPVYQLCDFSTKHTRSPQKRSKSSGSDSGEVNLSKKELALQEALDQITASYGQDSIMWLGRSHAPKDVPVVSTGSFSLDMALGIGGLPKGRIVEIYGPEASGKTTLALHVIAEAQKRGGYCAFVDAEHALDRALAQSIGVNINNLYLPQPDYGDPTLNLVDTLIRSHSVAVVVVDSGADLVTKSELDGEMGYGHMAVRARLMSQALRKLCHSLSESQAILLFINEVRSKDTIGGSGCNALKFYASVRLNVKQVGLVIKGEETTGSQVMVTIVKNKHAPPFRTAQFELEVGKGISQESELIELGLKHKFITKTGGSYYAFDGQSFKGKDAATRYLAENEGTREDLKTKLRQKILDTNSDKKTDPECSDEDGETLDEVVTSSMDEETVAGA